MLRRRDEDGDGEKRKGAQMIDFLVLLGLVTLTS